jgi:pSer/pThr/pTyr-binding forkhead associated (FHA) protein
LDASAVTGRLLEGVSRLHAVLRKFGDEWFVEDLASTNGTRVNGIRIRSATAVRGGDRLGLGGTAFRVERPKH